MSSQVYGINGLTQVNDRIKAVSSAPNTSTRGKLGDFLVVKSTGYLYYLSNADSGVYTWIKYGTFTNDVDITGNVDITGDSNLTGALDVTGATGLTGDVTIVGDSDLTGAFEVTGATTLTGAVGITGDVSVTGDVAIADGNALLVGSGSVTSFAGKGTLAAGVLTILNTKIKATDLVFIQRININGSTAIGHLTYIIVENTSLRITSMSASDSVQTNDISNIAYFIIKTS